MSERTVVQGEALAWLAANPAAAGTSVVTSLPDVSELDLPFEGWRAWFIDAARRILRWVPESGVAIFYQSDIRRSGAWVDKGYLVQRAAEDEGVALLWHSIACREPAGVVSQGRATYSHLLCFAATARPGPRTVPDVLPQAGFQPWSKATGAQACRAACHYLATVTATRLVVDPFCGQGTVIAAANELGLDALGVELSAKRCRIARTLTLPAP